MLEKSKELQIENENEFSSLTPEEKMPVLRRAIYDREAYANDNSVNPDKRLQLVGELWHLKVNYEAQRLITLGVPEDQAVGVAGSIFNEGQSQMYQYGDLGAMAPRIAAKLPIDDLNFIINYGSRSELR